MFALTLVCLLVAVVAADAGYLGAGISPFALSAPAPVAFPSGPILPGYGVLPYAGTPFTPFGYTAPVIKTPVAFGYPAPVIKSYSFGYPAPVIKTFGHFDYHETPIIKAAPLEPFHVKAVLPPAPVLKAFPGYAGSFAYPHASIW